MWGETALLGSHLKFRMLHLATGSLNLVCQVARSGLGIHVCVNDFAAQKNVFFAWG